jgi:hypothetical protein
MKNLSGLTRKLSERSRRRADVFQWRLVGGHIDPLGAVERNNYFASESGGIPIELQLTLELVDDPADNSSAEALATRRRWNLCRGPLFPPR